MRGFVLLLDAVIVAFLVITLLLIFFQVPILHVSPLIGLIQRGDADSVLIDAGHSPAGDCRFFTDPATLTVVSHC